MNRPKKQGTLSAKKMINSLPSAHFEVYKVFVCVHNVLCAVQVAFPSKLILTSVWAHQCIWFWYHQKGVLLLVGEKDRRALPCGVIII